MAKLRQTTPYTLSLAGSFTALAVALMAAPAAAQDAQGASDNSITSTESAPEAEQASTPIVVTGSRIQRQDYNANSPMVTVDRSLLENSSTAALEVNLNKLPQFVAAQTPTTEGPDIQPTATNTPGAATISLRGLGATRNLVLVDGRRVTPSNASGVVDITTIPSAAIERVEVISGGASATYGADAIAGVTNFILRKNFQGLEFDGQLGIDQYGDGFEYQLSGIMGTDFPDNRGNVSIAMSINTREASFQRNRPWYRDLWADPQVAGTQFFLDRPGINLTGYNIDPAALAAVFPNANPPVPGGFGQLTAFANPDGTVFTGNTFATRGGLYKFQGSTAPGSQYKIDATGTLGQNNTNLYLVLPLTRYNMYARGNYELNDWIGVFGQALFSSVSTYTRNEPGPITTGWDVSIPHGSQVYTGNARWGIPSSLNPDGTTNAAYLAGGRYGLNCPAVGGCTASQVFPVSAEMQRLLAGRQRPAQPGEPGYDPTLPFQPLVSAANDPFSLQALMPQDRETFTDVTTYNMLAGFEGKVPGTDWTWEAFVDHGISTTLARQTGIYSLERTRAVLGAPNYGQGFSYTGNAQSGGFGASTGRCTSGLNFLSPPAGGYSEDCLTSIRADLNNRSTMRQTIVEANLQGGLFNLPAGQLRFALGASYRENAYQFINDTLTSQGISFNDQAIGIYPSGNANGFISAKELYGELLVPVLKDIPFVQELNLEIGGRMSDYNTTGTSYTYKVLGDWRATDWLRFRGGYNRAERAPNIGELFLSAQQTFGVSTAGDPCSLANPLSFSANPANANGANVRAVCGALMRQAGQTAEAQYYSGVQDPSTFGFAFPTLVGNRNLTPEKADTWTAGVVVQSPISSGLLSRLRLSVDWYDIKVNNAIGAQTVSSALQQCFDPALNPLVATNPAAAAATQFCQNVPRTGTGALGNVYTTYVNNGRFHIEGIDAQLDWAAKLGPGQLTLNVVASYLMHLESAALPNLPLLDYVGTFGPGENGLDGGGAYRYRLLTNVGYSIGPARIALQWQRWPGYEDAAEVISGQPTSTTGAPAYDLFSLNGGYQVTKDVNLRFGVDNLFNTAPPLTGTNPGADLTLGQLRGGTYSPGIYDTIGRRFYIGANVRF